MPLDIKNISGQYYRIAESFGNHRCMNGKEKSWFAGLESTEEKGCLTPLNKHFQYHLIHNHAAKIFLKCRKFKEIQGNSRKLKEIHRKFKEIHMKFDNAISLFNVFGEFP